CSSFCTAPAMGCSRLRAVPCRSRCSVRTAMANALVSWVRLPAPRRRLRRCCSGCCATPWACRRCSSRPGYASRRLRRCFACIPGRATLTMIAVLLHDLDAVPPPIDAVAPDQTVLDLHHLDKIHLLTAGLGARIFPHQLAPVGEEAVAVALPAGRGVLEHDPNEIAQLVALFDDPAFRLEQV